jgi:enoyl-CoA hydratase/carnithine racemase
MLHRASKKRKSQRRVIRRADPGSQRPTSSAAGLPIGSRVGGPFALRLRGVGPEQGTQRRLRSAAEHRRVGPSSIACVEYERYTALRIRIEGGVAFATIDHPPINLLDGTLIVELDRFGREVEDDPVVRVVVIDSANPEFFIAHADVNLILRLPREPQPPPTELPFFHAMADRFRTMPKATIAVIAGCARGGGSELALAMDMRFAARGKAVLAQPEVALGLIPGGGGTQRLARLVGRARALEIVLGCNDIDADLAERWGYVNRALDEDELRPFVDALARRIASFPAEAVAHAKAAVTAAEADLVPGLLDEAHRFAQTLAAEETITRMERFLELGGQTREFELDVGFDPNQLARGG